MRAYKEEASVFLNNSLEFQMVEGTVVNSRET